MEFLPEGERESYRTVHAADQSEIATLRAQLAERTKERDEARQFAQDVYSKRSVVTCVYCAHEFPVGTPAAGAQILKDHIRACEKHPMRALEKDLDAANARAEKLQAFKDWVHKYLDGKGIPHHPPGTHGAEGCRIGDRMDYVFAEKEKAEQSRDAFQNTCGELVLENAALREEMRIIADADTGKWDVDMRDQFQAWAQNRLHAALSQSAQGEAPADAKGKAPSGEPRGKGGEG